MGKVCSACGETRDARMYSRDNARPSGYRSSCKKCNKTYNTKNNARQTAEYRRAAGLKHKYSMTVEEYDELLHHQHGVCAICFHINTNGDRLAVDHNHTTLEVRGLLCRTCNAGIGYFKDSVVYLRSAINYIEHEGSYSD
jgi:hypothetical protein